MAVIREYIVMALVDRNFGSGARILMTYNNAALYHKGVTCESSKLLVKRYENAMKTTFSDHLYDMCYPPGIEHHWWTLARNGYWRISSVGNLAALEFFSK